MIRRLMAFCLFAATLAVLPAAVAGETLFSDQERATIESMALSALPPLPVDTTNRFADLPGPAALGATLFFEQRLSRDGTVACASCHMIDRQFQDDRPRAQIGARRMSRRTMPLVGVAYNRWFFWDGRRDSLWSQALVPLENQLEHGGNRAFYAHVVADKLRDRYEHVFGPLPDLSRLPRNAGPLGTSAERAAWSAMTRAEQQSVDDVFANLGKALAAFERTIMPTQTRFDRFADALSAGRSPDPDASLTAQEADGLKLFIGKARCSSCHMGPLFTDGAFHNTAVPAVAGLPEDLGRENGVGQVLADQFNCLGMFRDGPESACSATGSMDQDQKHNRRAYKTPSLRGAASRPPYMHAGQFATLEAVVDHYASTPPAGSELRPVTLTADDRAALVTFLKTLSD